MRETSAELEARIENTAPLDDMCDFYANYTTRNSSVTSVQFTLHWLAPIVSGCPQLNGLSRVESDGER